MTRAAATVAKGPSLFGILGLALLSPSLSVYSQLALCV